jgi:hypothetical protein
MVVTANHYSLTSAPFSVVPSTSLVLVAANAGVHVGYPAAVENVDITARPLSVSGGTFSGRPFSGATISTNAVPAGAVLDAYGNCNGSAFGGTGSVSACPSVAERAPSGNGTGQALPNTAAPPSSAAAGLFAGAALGVVAWLGRGRRRRSATASSPTDAMCFL